MPREAPPALAHPWRSVWNHRRPNELAPRRCFDHRCASVRATWQALAPLRRKLGGRQKRRQATRGGRYGLIAGARVCGFSRRSPLRRPRAMPPSKRVNPVAKKNRCAATKGFWRAVRVGPSAGGGSISEPQPASSEQAESLLRDPCSLLGPWKFAVPFAGSKAGHQPCRPHHDWLSAMSGCQVSVSHCAISLQSSLIQGIGGRDGFAGLGPPPDN